MATKLKHTDARIRIAKQKIEMIATNIATTFDRENIDKTDTLIELLYTKTKALRCLDGVDRQAYAGIKVFLNTFNMNEFAQHYEA